jgi:hypothetical protein
MTGASQASLSGGTSVEELMDACQELSHCYHGASSTEVREWTPEHVNNAFGWAEWVEHVMVESIEADMVSEIDARLAALHSALVMSRSSSQPLWFPQPLTVEELRSARVRLLRLLLVNGTATREVVSCALSRAFGWEDGENVATAGLLPTVRLSAQLQLIQLMRQRVHLTSDCAGAHDDDTADAADVTSAAPRTAAASGGGGGAAATLTTGTSTGPGTGAGAEGRPSAAMDRAIVATEAVAAAVAAAAVVRPDAQMSVPATAVGLAQLMWSSSSDASAPLSDAVRRMHAAVAAGGHGAASLWRMPPDTIASACAAEALHAAALSTADRSCTPLLHAYCAQLHARGRALLQPDGGTRGEWREWCLRWSALLAQEEPTRGRAESEMLREVERLPKEQQARLRYLMQTDPELTL